MPAKLQTGVVMLKDKKVVIIGGTSGMGLELARLVLSLQGCPTVVGRNAERVKEALALLNHPAKGFAADIADRQALKAIFEQTGGLDHLVITAADLVFKPFGSVTPEEIQRAINSKILGPYFAAQFAAPRLSREGSITFFSGLAAYKPSAGTSVVATVNAALEGLAKSLAVELSPVRVNVISPGVVDTPIWEHLPVAERQAFYDGVARNLPARRIGTSADLAQATLFVMTNPFVTGTVLHVDGGGRLS